MTDLIGTRGEKIAELLLTEFRGRAQPLFHPRFLGEKMPAIDFLVELEGAEGSRPFFFAQVKTTVRGYSNAGRLRAECSRRDLERLLLYPAPTYLIGIDEPAQRGYVVSVNSALPRRLGTVCTQYPLEGPTLELLWQEVRQFWDDRDMVLRDSVFSD